MGNYRPVKLAVKLCCWATEDINRTMNKHCKVIAQYPQDSFNILCQDTPCLEKLPLLTAFSKYVSVWWKYKRRRGRPVNFMTKLQQHWPMQCQWNTERVSHFHQGSHHWESWNSKNRDITTEARHGARVKLPLLIYQSWPMQCQWNTEQLSHCNQGSQV